MSVRKVKTPAKLYKSDLGELQVMVLRSMDKIANIVGSSLGPGGRNVIIESDLIGIQNKNTKDGVSIFRALGAQDPYEHLIIEQTRDAAIKTVNEAGDGTTTATIIAASLIKNLFQFCNKNRRYRPQKVTRIINKLLNDVLIPSIQKQSIKITDKNREKLLLQVATISSNGDVDMAKVVMEAFESIGFGTSSHVTIQELSGPSSKYEVDKIEGFPIDKGYEESIGKFHAMFINNQGQQRCDLDTPLFILFDGNINDMMQVSPILSKIGEEYANGNSDFKNIIILAHGFSEQVLNSLAFNFVNPSTINVVPLMTPMNQLMNSQLEFLKDVSAFTGAKVFGMAQPLSQANPIDFGNGVEKIEISRFRSTIVGNPDPMNVEGRAADLNARLTQTESKIEKIIIEDTLGRLTCGIAQLKIYGASTGELKEKIDRAEDAVCAVRAAVNSGCLAGGCRTLINLSSELLSLKQDQEIIANVLVPSLLAPFFKLLDNAGYNEEEVSETLTRLTQDKNLVYDVENGVFGSAKELGVYDATMAVEQALKNAISIASVMGTLGGIITSPRDGMLERQEAIDQANFQRDLDHADQLTNEANLRP